MPPVGLTQPRCFEALGLPLSASPRPSPLQVTVVPWDYKFSEAVSEYDGLFLSNGPGDPTKCVSTIEELKKVIALEGSAMRPIFGICLGNQLMALAAGASAVKMPFGNRGQNQPVRNVLTGECYITPQNHGFAIDDSKLPSGDLASLPCPCHVFCG